MGLNIANGVEKLKVAAIAITGITNATATYTALASDYVINCTNTFVLTLPTAVGIMGKVYVIKNSGVGTITVTAAGAETIDGSNTAVMAVQYNSITIQSTGTAWIII
jgi:hypothetical protein